MHSKTRWALTISVLAITGVLVLKFATPREPPPEFALPDGSILRLMAVTYGTNHFVGTPFQRMFMQLPTGVAGVVEKVIPGLARGRTRKTFTPLLMVWLQWVPNLALVAPPNAGRWLQTNSHSLLGFMADETDFASGEECAISGAGDVYSMQFWVFPRRRDTLGLQIRLRDKEGLSQPYAKIELPNPLYRKYPVWTAESLPATKAAGDVSATLEAFYTGCNNQTTYKRLPNRRTGIFLGTDLKRGANQAVGRLRFSSPRGTNELWTIAQVDVSDATGNASHCSAWGYSRDTYFNFNPALWPGETAWKVNLEVKRKSNFAPEELLVFKGVLLGAIDTTNHPGLAQTAGGVEVRLEKIVRRAPNTNTSWSTRDLSCAVLKHRPLPPQSHLDLVSVETDSGQAVGCGSYGSSGDIYTYYFQTIPLAATNLTFTFAIHRSRFVEFMVKPALATEDQPICEF